MAEILQQGHISHCSSFIRILISDKQSSAASFLKCCEHAQMISEAAFFALYSPHAGKMATYVQVFFFFLLERYYLLVGAVLAPPCPIYFDWHSRRIECTSERFGGTELEMNLLRGLSVQQGVAIGIRSRSLTFFAARPFTSLMVRLMACPARVEKRRAEHARVLEQARARNAGRAATDA